MYSPHTDNHAVDRLPSTSSEYKESSTIIKTVIVANLIAMLSFRKILNFGFQSTLERQHVKRV